MSTARRSFTATMLAFLLVAVGVFSIWMLTGSGVFASSSPVLDGPLPVSAGAVTAGAGADAGLPLAASVQVAQPRDPFAPLTSEPPVTSSTLPGQTTTLPGQTTTTTPGQSTTTTTEGFDPDGTSPHTGDFLSEHPYETGCGCHGLSRDDMCALCHD